MYIFTNFNLFKIPRSRNVKKEECAKLPRSSCFQLKANLIPLAVLTLAQILDPLHEICKNDIISNKRQVMVKIFVF